MDFMDFFVGIIIFARGRLFSDMLIYTFIVKFCQGNMNTVREKSGKCQGILKKPVAMNPASCSSCMWLYVIVFIML